MGKIVNYPVNSMPSLNDRLIGTDVDSNNETKNFLISDVLSLVGGVLGYVPYTGAIADVNLGVYKITADKFIKSGGTSSQFLKADGSIDSSIYLTTTSLLGYIPYSGATDNVHLGAYTITANKIIKSGGLTSQFLKANGDIDSTVYLPASSAYVPKYASYYDTTTQTVVSGASKAMQFNTPNLYAGITIANDLLGKPTRITVDETGTYNIQFSAQIVRTSGGSPKRIVIWVKVNGVDVPWSSTYATVEANSDHTVIGWNFFIYMINAQYAELWWTQDDDITFGVDPVSLIYPNVPSVILTVSKVS